MMDVRPAPAPSVCSLWTPASPGPGLPGGGGGEGAVLHTCLGAIESDVQVQSHLDVTDLTVAQYELNVCVSLCVCVLTVWWFKSMFSWSLLIQADFVSLLISCGSFSPFLIAGKSKDFLVKFTDLLTGEIWLNTAEYFSHV